VFAKEKQSNKFKKHKKPSHFKFTLRGEKEVYFRFFCEGRISLERFPPFGQNNTRCLFCETSLNAERKNMYFFRSRLVHYDQPVFNPFFPNEFSVKT
jgi:hypothetical protein